MADWSERVALGAAYYPEYHGFDRVERDLDLIAAAGLSVIRVGESVWSTWEPENGRFELDWLEPVLDAAHRRGIHAVVGTATYAVPPWLARLYPEIAGERSSGTRIPWGARQEVDLTHPAYRFHAERLIRAVVGRYARHPAVIGFQLDNEPGNELLHNRGVFERFVDHLRLHYHDVEVLNRLWGLAHWSHRLSTWADLWRPEGNVQPGYALAWRRFQAELVTEFIGWQARIAREYTRPGQFLTTCLSYDRPAVDDVGITAALDVTAGNLYYTTQDDLSVRPGRPPRYPWIADGACGVFQAADRMYGSRREPFLVTETNAGAIGPPSLNRPPFPGQLRQAAWAMVARGARLVEYWPWQTIPFGAETFWGGVLPHSGKPGRVYRELRELGAELARAAPALEGFTPDADLVLLHSTPSSWLLESVPELVTADDVPDPLTYRGFVDPFYRSAFEAGLQVRILSSGAIRESAAELAARHPLLVAAALYTTTDRELQLLLDYAAAGGHLVVGPRTGVLDAEARVRTGPLPGLLAEAAGAWYEEWTATEPVPLSFPAGSPLTGGVPAPSGPWADGLIADDCEVLAGYAAPHLRRFAAVTSRRHGRGRVTLVGTLPTGEFGRRLLRWAGGARGGWAGAAWAPSVTAASGTGRDGCRIWVLHNWAWSPVTLTSPEPARDLLCERALPAGGRLTLGPWDVRVLVTQPGAAGARVTARPAQPESLSSPGGPRFPAP